MNGSRGRAISGAFVFLLLGVFAVFATVLVMLGARAYQSTVDRTEAHSTARVLESYIINAVRTDDAAGAVSVNDEKVTDAEYRITPEMLEGEGLLIRKGKKSYHKLVAKK